MALVNQADLEARLGRTLTTEEATAFTTINAANQAYIEKLIGSSLEATTETTRYYDGGLQHLAIDPCTDISAVKLYDYDYTVVDTYDTSDYTTEPVNQTLKTMIRNRWGKFTRGMNYVGVTAKFSIAGDTNIQNIVKNVLLALNSLVLEANINIQQESIEGYSVNRTNLTTLANSFKQHPSIQPLFYLFPEVI